MATDPRIYQVEGRLIKETAKAVLVRIDLIDDEPCSPAKSYWFPKSQVVDSILVDPIFEPDSLDKFTMKHWIMDQHGFVGAVK